MSRCTAYSGRSMGKKYESTSKPSDTLRRDSSLYKFLFTKPPGQTDIKDCYLLEYLLDNNTGYMIISCDQYACILASVHLEKILNNGLSLNYTVCLINKHMNSDVAR